MSRVNRPRMTTGPHVCSNVLFVACNKRTINKHGGVVSRVERQDKWWFIWG